MANPGNGCPLNGRKPIGNCLRLVITYPTYRVSYNSTYKWYMLQGLSRLGVGITGLVDGAEPTGTKTIERKSI